MLICLLDFGNTCLKVKVHEQTYWFGYDQIPDFETLLLQIKPDICYYFWTCFAGLAWFETMTKLHHWKVQAITSAAIQPYLQYDPLLQIDQLGVDLGLMSLYVQQTNPQANLMVIGLGTWTTILDFQAGQLCNVGIVPGLSLSHQTMFNYHPGQPNWAVRGDNNDHVFGYGQTCYLRGLISDAHAHGQTVILTGGHAVQASKDIDISHVHIIPDLAFLGCECFLKLSLK